MKCTLLMGWIAIRELLYERVFYLLIIFSLLSLALSLLLGQMTYAEQAKLTLDFMLGGIEISMILFSVFMGISLFQREITSGSISMTLSKPIFRSQFLLGKYLGQVTIQSVVILMMGVVTALCSARLGTQVNTAGIFQFCFMVILEVGVLTSITYLFAVSTGATTTAIATLCFFIVGHLKEPISRNTHIGQEPFIWILVNAFIPDLDIFNIKNLVSYGYTVTGEQLGWALLYATFCVTLFLAISAFAFSRRDILT